MEWPNTFDTVAYQSDHATSDAGSPIQKSDVFSQVSMSKGAQVIVGTTKLTENDKFLNSRAKTNAVDYTPDWISVETYIQRTDKPYELFTKWENIGVGTNFKVKSKSVEVDTNAPITKGAFYQGFSVHSAPYDVDLATCYSQPLCTDIRLQITFDGPYFFNPQSSPLIITPIQQQGGTITPPNPVTVSVGGSQLFTITPSSGYVINDVRVNGVSKGAISSYQFTDVRADQTISATFKQVPTSSGWNWATQGWGDWQHSATWTGGTGTEYLPVMVGNHGEHGADVHLSRGTVTSTVERTFTAPAGTQLNKLTLVGRVPGSDTPAGRWLRIYVNGVLVHSSSGYSSSDPANQYPSTVTATFSPTNTAKVTIMNGQNPAWGVRFFMEYYSLGLNFDPNARSAMTFSSDALPIIEETGLDTSIIVPNMTEISDTNQTQISSSLEVTNKT